MCTLSKKGFWNPSIKTEWEKLTWKRSKGIILSIHRKCSFYSTFKVTVLFFVFVFCFCVVFWTVVAVQRPSRSLHRMRLFFTYLTNGTEHGSQPSLTTRDRELVSVLEVRIESGDLNPRPLTQQSVTLPTLPRTFSSACGTAELERSTGWRWIGHQDPTSNLVIPTFYMSHLLTERKWYSHLCT